jgi:sugar O-acyltransferase (sialic acid O-acetyltransferase NeuD family)
MSSEVFVVGASGQARETAQLISLLGLTATGSVVLVDEGEEDAVLDSLAAAGRNVVAALGIGRPRLRQRTWEAWQRRTAATWPLLQHPRAVVGASTELGEGVMVAAGAVTTCDVRVGTGALLNCNVSIGHDVTVGAFSVVNPGATLAGGVTLGEAVLVGAGANVLEGVSVGPGAVVGAGAVVTRDVPTGTVVAGVPAKELRR